MSLVVREENLGVTDVLCVNVFLKLINSSIARIDLYDCTNKLHAAVLQSTREQVFPWIHQLPGVQGIRLLSLSGATA